MNSNGSVFVKVAGVCLILLLLVSAGWTLATSFGLIRIGGALGSTQILGGQMNGEFPRGDFQNNGNIQSPENFQPPENFQGRSFDGSPTRMGGSGLFGVVRWLGIGLNITALMIGVAAVIGLFKKKKWGAVLAIILAILLGLSSLFGLFRIMMPQAIIQTIAKLVLVLAVVVLLLLSPTRKVFQPPAAVEAIDDDDDTDDE